MSTAKPLDVLAIGRASVDLYGAQVGGRLEDMRSFRKYIGGSPTNIAAGAARLGLRSALITRVGDEPMGRFVREQLIREGVDVRGVATDPYRLTALVLLGIRDDARFPMMFYREDCADMALCEDDVDEALVAEAGIVLATGTHLSHPRTEAAVIRALDLARAHGARTALDIDYRPPLWGLGRMGEGESRYVASDAVTARLRAVLHRFDLIVGTEEEVHIAGGTTDTLAALRSMRAATDAVLVCKRGPAGAVVIEGAVPDRMEDAPSGAGFAVEVFNAVGAGDGFMAGLLKGWVEGATWDRALTLANACGALAVSRHGCTPAYPSAAELDLFLARGVTTPALRHDAALEQVHWSTNRPAAPPDLRILAFDHRAQLEAMPGYDPARGAAFKRLCLEAGVEVAAGRPGYGILCCDRIGRGALHAAAGAGLWIGRPCERPGSRPLALEPALGPDAGGLEEWPAGTVAKVLCFAGSGDDAAMRAAQGDVLRRLLAAARRNALEVMLELIAPDGAANDAASVAASVGWAYDEGLRPDWWKLPSQPDAAAWRIVAEAVGARDPHVRGIVILGLGELEAALVAGFRAAAGEPMVRGFAVGRTLIDAAARVWFAGEADPAAVRADIAARYARLCAAWDARAEDGPD